MTGVTEMTEVIKSDQDDYGMTEMTEVIKSDQDDYGMR